RDRQGTRPRPSSPGLSRQIRSQLAVPILEGRTEHPGRYGRVDTVDDACSAVTSRLELVVMGPQTTVDETRQHEIVDEPTLGRRTCIHQITVAGHPSQPQGQAEDRIACTKRRRFGEDLHRLPWGKQAGEGSWAT